jgi:3-carboxy-cis,cis-muconate cycloisomerase
MPHKRNPVGASVAAAAAIRAPGLVATMVAAMPQEHERALGGWQVEWETIPELVHLTGGAARAIADALEGLVIDAERMRANLDATHGLVLAESVSMALARHVGKARAHELIQSAAHRATDERLPLADVLAADPDVTRWLDRSEIERRLDPEQYLGASRAFVERALARHDQRPSANA